MAQYGTAVMTDAGASLLADSIANGYKIEFVKMVVGSGVYTQEEKERTALKTQNALKEKRQEFGFSSVTATEESEILLKAVISNTEIDEGYYIREIGIVAKAEGAADEILYSIVIAEIPDFLPVKENPTEIIQEYYTKVYNSEMVVINVRMGVYALAEDFVSHIEKENPHNVTKEQVGLGEVPNVSTNNQTPTYKEAGELAGLESGETLSTAFGKIAKAVKEFISHITTKATTSVLGHVKLSDSSAVTDPTGLALPATEKNAAIGGTLANQISKVNSDLGEKTKWIGNNGASTNVKTNTGIVTATNEDASDYAEMWASNFCIPNVINLKGLYDISFCDRGLMPKGASLASLKSGFYQVTVDNAPDVTLPVGFHKHGVIVILKGNYKVYIYIDIFSKIAIWNMNDGGWISDSLINTITCNPNSTYVYLESEDNESYISIRRNGKIAIANINVKLKTTLVAGTEYALTSLSSDALYAARSTANCGTKVVDLKIYSDNLNHIIIVPKEDLSVGQFIRGQIMFFV